MKTFDSGLNEITVDENDNVLKIDFRECWSFDVTVHPDWQDVLDCFCDNLLNEFKISQPNSIDELLDIIKPLWKEWDMDNRHSHTVYDWDSDSLQVGYGMKKDKERDYMTVIDPMITFKLK